MIFLENKIPPPIVTALSAAIMWWVSTVTPILEVNSKVQFVIIVIAAGTSFFFAVSGIAAFKRKETTISPLKPDTTTSLVSSGIYRVSRNPMYVGLALLLFTLAMYLLAPVSLLGVLGFILYMNRFQIAPEERALEKIFGNEFEEYKLQVRRWL